MKEEIRIQLYKQNINFNVNNYEKDVHSSLFLFKYFEPVLNARVMQSVNKYRDEVYSLLILSCVAIQVTSNLSLHYLLRH